ncbi:MAG: glycosyltransferase family A protein [Gemmatimonadaceae bacterium]|nr:glycosyltransferase family A protein [Gemmatimonadaceae bacterium]
MIANVSHQQAGSSDAGDVRRASFAGRLAAPAVHRSSPGMDRAGERSTKTVAMASRSRSCVRDDSAHRVATALDRAPVDLLAHPRWAGGFAVPRAPGVATRRRGKGGSHRPNRCDRVATERLEYWAIEPEFSILMATYQHAHLIERAVRSVASQTHQNWELLVADDGSTDDTFARLSQLARAEPRLRFWRHQNKGQARARNGLLHHARGRWVTFLDSDDELTPSHLAARAQAIQQQPEVDLILAPMQVIGEPWVTCRHGSSQPVHLDQCLAVGMLTVRADRLRAAGGFPHANYGEDAMLIQALQRDYAQQTWIEGSAPTCATRKHGAGLTAQRMAASNRRRLLTEMASPS